MFDLDRFKSAQKRSFEGFDAALHELQQGGKRGHWIWYIFPQIAGLGHSSMAVRYGIQGTGEAAAYLRDALLRDRLLAVTRAVVGQLQRRPATRLDALMGSDIDARKLVSSMTLFREVARRLNVIEPLADHAELATNAGLILRRAADQGLAECASTIRMMRDGSPAPDDNRG